MPQTQEDVTFREKVTFRGRDLGGGGVGFGYCLGGGRLGAGRAGAGLGGRGPMGEGHEFMGGACPSWIIFPQLVPSPHVLPSLAPPTPPLSLSLAVVFPVPGPESARTRTLMSVCQRKEGGWMEGWLLAHR